MKVIDFCEIMGEINGRYIAEAHGNQSKKSVWLKWGTLAACLALLCVLGIPHLIDQNGDKGGLSEAETFQFDGIKYVVLSESDMPENYGLPAEITAELAGERLTCLKRGDDGNLMATEEETGTVLFAYKNWPCDAAKLICHEGKWYGAAFIGTAAYTEAFDAGTEQPVDFSELYRLYGVGSAQDIAAIYVDGEPYLDRMLIDRFYAMTQQAKGRSRDALFASLPLDMDDEAIHGALHEDFRKLRIETAGGVSLYFLQFYPSFGYLRSVYTNAYYELEDIFGLQ